VNFAQVAVVQAAGVLVVASLAVVLVVASLAVVLVVASLAVVRAVVSPQGIDRSRDQCLGQSPRHVLFRCRTLCPLRFLILCRLLRLILCRLPRHILSRRLFPCPLLNPLSISAMPNQRMVASSGLVV